MHRLGGHAHAGVASRVLELAQPACC
jgi:hypothetical protein